MLGTPQQLGCSSVDDCVIAGLTCEQVGGVGRCVELCSSDAYCTGVVNSPGTRCIGETDEEDLYCVEDLDP